MSEIQIANTYGPIFGMDMMCDGTIPDSLRIGDVVARGYERNAPMLLTVAALDVRRTAAGEMSDIVGIGLKGDGAHGIRAGDVLTVVPHSADC